MGENWEGAAKSENITPLLDIMWLRLLQKMGMIGLTDQN